LGNKVQQLRNSFVTLKQWFSSRYNRTDAARACPYQTFFAHPVPGPLPGWSAWVLPTKAAGLK
jgi:hypothetical protein